MSTPAKSTPSKPQDRLPKAEAALEARLEQDDLLADLPTLRAPHRLRIRQRNEIVRIALSLAHSGVTGDLDTSTVEGRKQLDEVLAAMAAVDEFAESIAEDREAYIEWAQGKEIDHFMSILNLYTEAAGESPASSN